MTLVHKASVSLAALIAILNPPETIETVEEYQKYIQQKLGADESVMDGLLPSKRPVGRPGKAQHPAYSAIEMKAIKKYVEQEFGMALNPVQPTDEKEIAMFDGKVLHFATRLDFVDDIAVPLFPPSVEG